MTLGVVLMVEACRGEVKLKVGKAVALLMGREMGGRSGNSGIYSQEKSTGLYFTSFDTERFWVGKTPYLIILMPF